MKRQQLAIALAVLALSNYGKPHLVFRFTFVDESSIQHVKTHELARELKQPQLACLLLLYHVLAVYT